MKIAYQGIAGSYSESCAKEKYPNCTVQIPSEKLLKNLFEAEPELGTLVMVGEWLKSWKNPYKTMEYI